MYVCSAIRLTTGNIELRETRNESEQRFPEVRVYSGSGFDGLLYIRTKPLFSGIALCNIDGRREHKKIVVVHNKGYRGLPVAIVAPYK